MAGPPPSASAFKVPGPPASSSTVEAAAKKLEEAKRLDFSMTLTNDGSPMSPPTAEGDPFSPFSVDGSFFASTPAHGREGSAEPGG